MVTHSIRYTRATSDQVELWNRRCSWIYEFGNRWIKCFKGFEKRTANVLTRFTMIFPLWELLCLKYFSHQQLHAACICVRYVMSKFHTLHSISSNMKAAQSIKKPKTTNYRRLELVILLLIFCSIMQFGNWLHAYMVTHSIRYTRATSDQVELWNRRCSWIYEFGNRWIKCFKGFEKRTANVLTRFTMIFPLWELLCLKYFSHQQLHAACICVRYVMSKFHTLHSISSNMKAAQSIKKPKTTNYRRLELVILLLIFCSIMQNFCRRLNAIHLFRGIYVIDIWC